MSSFLHDYCKSYENSLNKDICEELIAMFRACPELHVRHDNGGFPNMTHMNFTENQKIHPILHQYLVEHAFKCIDQYKKDVPETRFWPNNFSFEQFRIKHYSAGGHDRFDEHIDSNDLISAKRFMIFFWYLNTPDSGGNTIITNSNLHYDAEQGKLLMFPPFWMYPHIGEPVTKGEKFLLSSYMHYSE